MVAIKTSKETKGEGAEEMLREAAVMAQVSGHPNLIALVGVVTSGAPLLLLLSFCEHGSLLSFLKGKAMFPKEAQLLPEDRVQMALDVAQGMAYLAENRFVHRDLAARNVLVNSELNCKVADFGLSRGTMGSGPDNDDGAGPAEEEEYYRSRTGTFPVRWTAPESMQTMRFSETSDVWSFGILLGEIFTNGGKPYVTLSNAMVITKVQEGYRDKQPDGCPAAVYAAMLRCWAAAPSDRPLFVELVAELQTQLPEEGELSNPPRDCSVCKAQLQLGKWFHHPGKRAHFCRGCYESQPQPESTATVADGNDVCFEVKDQAVFESLFGEASDHGRDGGWEEERGGGGGGALSNPTYAGSHGGEGAATGGGRAFANSTYGTLSTANADTNDDDDADQYLTVSNQDRGSGGEDGASGISAPKKSPFDATMLTLQWGDDDDDADRDGDSDDGDSDAEIDLDVVMKVNMTMESSM